MEAPSPEELRCPVCRARQPLQETCRRCDADLSLLVRGLAYCSRLRERCERALAAGDVAAARAAANELVALRPDAAARGLADRAAHARPANLAADKAD